jgi:hypothetical protein
VPDRGPAGEAGDRHGLFAWAMLDAERIEANAEKMRADFAAIVADALAYSGKAELCVREPTEGRVSSWDSSFTREQIGLRIDARGRWYRLHPARPSGAPSRPGGAAAHEEIIDRPEEFFAIESVCARDRRPLEHLVAAPHGFTTTVHLNVDSVTHQLCGIDLETLHTPAKLAARFLVDVARAARQL